MNRGGGASVSLILLPVLQHRGLLCSHSLIRLSLSRPPPRSCVGVRAAARLIASVTFDPRGSKYTCWENE